MSNKGEFQSNRDQYKMPDALKQKKDFVYRVGYTSSTGNQTNNEEEPVKRSDL
ncbi:MULTISPECIES: hypothetical protein [unclassified Bacillus (in: firmicutes)]|uniref:hypothetical protein n=1 Tax=unclassified Bacillus (in: firmicutes) TaxID=185979 RepID=UPI001BE95E20|nr:MULTISPECIES: hypothetical protein [unclassified Bacillus (in: firmicutes)]MBT2639567.1 hypothetical protein [Bacillus sp. ISL-39]MBT2662570.1 hypothetical protein [Bacillus sp. ISL-45]